LRGILEDHLATKTPEQRARVTLPLLFQGAEREINFTIDGKFHTCESVTGAIQFIDRALAKPAPLDDVETEFLHGMEKAASAEVQRHLDAGRSVVGTVARPAVGTTHPFAVAEADALAHGSRWDRKGVWTWTARRGEFGWQPNFPRGSGHAWERGQLPATETLTRLPDDQPDGVPEDCNCEQARELREELEHVRGLLDDVRANRVEDRKTRDALRNQISGGNDDIDKLRDDCDAARETIARLTKERDEREAARAEADRIACKVFAEHAALTAERVALRAQVETEHERRWWETYNAALTGVLAYSGNEPPLTKSPHKESALHADAAHGPRGEQVSGYNNDGTMKP
jgi:hypothetical protein